MVLGREGAKKFSLFLCMKPSICTIQKDSYWICGVKVLWGGELGKKMSKKTPPGEMVMKRR